MTGNLIINFAEKLQKQAVNIDWSIFNCYNSDWKYEYWEWRYSIMLIQFTVENHRSIKNSAAISFAASKDKSFDEYLLHPDEKKALLPVLAIYGANAAGKSNVLHAMMTFWANYSTQNDSKEPYRHDSNGN